MAQVYTSLLGTGLNDGKREAQERVLAEGLVSCHAKDAYGGAVACIMRRHWDTMHLCVEEPWEVFIKPQLIPERRGRV